jgi:hypothetical protein
VRFDFARGWLGPSLSFSLYSRSKRFPKKELFLKIRYKERYDDDDDDDDEPSSV